MATELICAVVASFAIAGILTGVVRKLAMAGGLLDLPNDRSSHSRPTPRGGGTSIVLATLLAWSALAWLGVIDRDLFIALSGGGVAVAFIGMLDDRFQLSARLRIVVHIASAVWAVYWIGGLHPVSVGGAVFDLPWSGTVLAVLLVVWVLNLFNFMDGIDGIAASEAVFVTWSGAGLLFLVGATGGVMAAALVTGAACLGFLLWNWPPARIFMGDVGSGYIGYVIAALTLAATREQPMAILLATLLGGVFVMDASITLVRRLLRGEPIHKPHRSHAYQWLARKFKSHRIVTLGVLAINFLWLLPAAAACVRWPAAALSITVGALVSLSIVLLISGSGRREAHPLK